MIVEKYITESSARDAIPRMNQLKKLLDSEDFKLKLEEAHMKTQKEAAKIFQMAIRLLEGLK